MPSATLKGENNKKSKGLGATLSISFLLFRSEAIYDGFPSSCSLRRSLFRNKESIDLITFTFWAKR